jgi:acyl-CoA reductase-like NAD-dependent aldehyde dehydrogenase
MRDQQLYVDGRWIDGTGREPVRSPYDDTVLGTYAVATPEQVTAAVDAAERVLATGLPAHRRAAILDAVGGIVAERREELAQVLSAEAGKPIKAARGEVDRGLTTLRLSADEARRLPAEAVQLDGFPVGDGLIAWTLPEPIGVVGAITPFNFPCNLVLHKLGPALAAGCPVVLKPSEKTPLTAGWLVAAFAEAGLPAGWLNLVTGDPMRIVPILQDDDRVAVLTFTGSSAVGWDIRAGSPRKHHVLELGSNTAMVVDESADLDLALAAAVSGGFGYAGQACISVQRLYVHDAVADEFLDRFGTAVDALVVGDPSDDRTDVGPLITPAAAERVLSWVTDAVAAGARLVTGGTMTGRLLRPTVLTDVEAASPLRCEEVFGPVVTVVRIKDVAEGLREVNDSRFGLNTAIYTNDLAHALDFARRAQAGTVLVNASPSFRADQMPYGGVKDSGHGREGVKYAVAALTAPKLVVINTAAR